MFAVPGWSVSAQGLKPEQESSRKENDGSAPSRKRKRGPKDASEEVTTSNIAELWESVVEGKKKDQTGQATKRLKNDDERGVRTKEGKKQKKQKKQNDSQEKQRDAVEASPLKEEKEDKDKQSKKSNNKTNKKNKGEVKSDTQDQDTSPEKATSELKAKSSNTSLAVKQPPLPPAPVKLTPLQASMREKLISARFRHLNETLYTSPSEEAFQLFKESPEMFDEYHEGFRRQVKVWPENPVDSFLKSIRARGKLRAPGRGQKGASGAAAGRPSTLASTPLPRTVGTAIIADLGCGDARLAESLHQAGDDRKLRLEVKSYDLQSPSPLVTKTDMANLPLEDGSVNVAIFCLALMGTNWVDFVEEAYRVLHWKGELWIAEIKSRFGPVKGKNAPVSHSVGNRKKAASTIPTKKGGKKGAAGRDNNGDDENDLATEVDGAEDLRRETDVSAFVEVLRKRGFVLQGEKQEAIDLSNKMFVRMHFIKGASPTKGKGVTAKDAEDGKMGRKGKARWPGSGRDGDDEDEDDTAQGGDEASVLKPCVYKIR